MRAFSYYQYDSVHEEKVIGIVVADSAKEAKEKVEKHYEHAYQKGFTKEGWEIGEIGFSPDGCKEIYYGG